MSFSMCVFMVELCEKGFYPICLHMVLMLTHTLHNKAIFFWCEFASGCSNMDFLKGLNFLITHCQFVILFLSNIYLKMFAHIQLNWKVQICTLQKTTFSSGCLCMFIFKFKFIELTDFVNTYCVCEYFKWRLIHVYTTCKNIYLFWLFINMNCSKI